MAYILLHTSQIGKFWREILFLRIYECKSMITLILQFSVCHLQLFTLNCNNEWCLIFVFFNFFLFHLKMQFPFVCYICSVSSFVEVRAWREREGLSPLKCLLSTIWEQTPCLQTPSCLPSHKSVSVKKNWTLVQKGLFSIVVDILETLHMLANTSRAICKHVGWEYFWRSVEWSQVENFTPFPSSAGGFQLNMGPSYFLQLRPQHFCLH